MIRGGIVVPLVAIAGIHYLSSLEPAELAAPVLPVPHADKGVHAVLFALLLCSFRAWRGWRRTPVEWLPGACAACLVVAGGDEWHQSFVPGRQSDVADFLADAVGIGLAAGVWAHWSRARAHRRLR